MPRGGEVLAVPAGGFEQLCSLLQAVGGSEVQLRSRERGLHSERRGGKQVLPTWASRGGQGASIWLLGTVAMFLCCLTAKGPARCSVKDLTPRPRPFRATIRINQRD